MTAGPRTIVDDSIERNDLAGLRPSRVEVIHPHRPPEVERPRNRLASESQRSADEEERQPNPEAGQ